MLSIKDKKALTNSIKHWKKMILFVEKTGIYEMSVMEKTLGETYSSEYCDLCEINVKEDVVYCANCILANGHVECSHKDSAWRAVYRTNNSGDWISTAKKMLTILQAILEGHDFRKFNDEGYDQFGYDCFGFNEDNYDRNGYDINGYNQYGYDINGYDREGYDYDNYDRNGYDKHGFDKHGYDINGCKKS